MTADVDRIAAERTAVSGGSVLSTPFVADYQRKGVIGEVALARFFDVPHIPRGDLRGGDGGCDLLIRFVLDQGCEDTFRVDVKCAAKPKELWVLQGSVKADVYVLAGYASAMDHAFCLGWQWATVVREAPVKDCRGRVNHFIAREALRGMDELKQRFAGVP